MATGVCKTVPIRSLMVLFVLVSVLLTISCSTTDTPNNQTDVGKVHSIKLGAVLPLTGGSAFYGQYARAGIDAEIQDINNAGRTAAGGIAGSPVTVVYEDTQSNKKNAATAAQKLIEVDDVDALITILSSHAGAVVPIAETSRVPLVYVSS